MKELIAVVLIFLEIHFVRSDYDSTTRGPLQEKKLAQIKSGSARQLFGSSFVRPNFGNQGLNIKSAPTSTNFPPHFDSDYYGQYPHYAHGVYTTEPLHTDLSPSTHLSDPRARIISGVYGVREFGERHSEAKGRQGEHLHDRVFRPQITFVDGDAHLLGPSDSGGNLCSNSCNDNQWMCSSTCTCIPKHERCNKMDNCDDGEDERDCDDSEDVVAKMQRICELTGEHVMCPRTRRCILKDWLCDGDDDCGDYTDETHCGSKNNCTDDQFECGNGFCIQKSWLCDGDNDCKDFSDEANCTKIKCTNEHFECDDGFCVSISFKCDGERDCVDGSDEKNCQAVINSCPEGEFKCRGGVGGAGGPGGRCVLNRFRCDGDNDCGDWSDEENCPKKPSSCTSNEYRCTDGVCIPNRWKCDGEQDCDGGEDEKECGNMTSSHSATCRPDEFTCKNGRCILITWLCDGYPDCSRGEDEVDCTLSCDPGQYLCAARKNFTNLKICVHQKHICDGENDCPNGEDEQNCPKIKECPVNSKCEQNCVQSAHGSDDCSCRVGFLLDANKRNCTDIDECQFISNPVCSQKCQNTPGSFVCTCEQGYILRPDLRTCKAMGGAMQLLVANRWDIRKVTLSNNRYNTVVKGLHNAIATDYHYQKGLLVWSDVSTDVIKMVHMNGTRVRDVIKWGLESPGGIAMDWIHDLLFWTDSGTRRVEVSNLEGNLRAVIAANDLDKPRAIVVHPGEALVFWSDWGPNPKIERSFMDGSERKVIISKGVTWPNGLAIDYPARKIYWADAKQHAIECANLDGTDRVKVLSSHLPHPFALTIFEDTMYWTDWNSKSVSAANKITGKGFRPVHENFHFPMDIHAYHPARQPEYVDRCQKDRRGLPGGCSHLCLPNKNSRRCSCPIGLTLKDDLKTCNSVANKLVLVARRKDIRLRQLDTKSTASKYNIDMIIPLDGLKHTIALDWCSETDFIYWTDVERSTINRAHLNGSYQEKVVHNNLVSPAGLALDWITDKLYWTDPDTNRIEVATTDGKMRTLLIWEKLDKPRDIVVNPIEGLMFWTDWGTKPTIERASMDGSDRKVLSFKNLQWPNGLAIDYDKQRLYFVDGGTKTLEYMDFDGSKRKTVISTGLEHPFGLDIHENMVFWTDWDTKSVNMADKLTGKNIKSIISNTSDLMDIRVFHRSRKRVHNPCGNGNGGCSHLCLLNTKGYSCACPIGVKLTSDLRTCEDGPSAYIIFAHRSDIRQISLDINHLIDVVLPLPPISNAVAVDVDLKSGNIFFSDTVEKLIMSSTPDGMHLTQIIGDSLENVDGLVVDSVGRNLYWTDAGRHTVECSDLNGKNRHLIAKQDLESPRGIALDYDSGYLFWTDWGHNPKIERADMDGEHRTKIITTNLIWPNSLSVDIDEKRIYWTDGQQKTIESSDYNGSKRKLILSSLQHPYSLAVANQHIYWTDWKSKALHMAELNNVSARTDIAVNIDGLMDVKVIKKNTILPENECGENNGGCSNLCLRNPKGYSCHCPIGIKLKGGSVRECGHLPEDYLLIAQRSGIGRISLDTDDLMDVVLPISGVHGAVVLDYHYNYSMLFFADVNLDVIRRINLANLTDTKTVITKDLSTPNGIAVDWVADNLYWSDTDQKVIEVSRLDGSSRKIILGQELNDPRSLIVHPKRGYLFWADWGTPPKIERCLLDGSNRTVVVTENLGFPTGLALDFSSHRLYWADALQDRIEMVDLNGGRRSVVVKLATHPFGVTLFSPYLFWTDWYNKSTYRAKNVSSGYKGITEIRHSLSGALDIRAVSRKRQPDLWNQCATKNGGCSHLCLFRGHDYVCACPDVADEKECSLLPEFVVPRPDDISEYTDEVAAEMTTENTMTASSAWNEERIFLIGSGIVTVLLVIVVITIAVLVINSKKPQRKRSTRSSRNSVMAFANPNYNIDGTPMEQKPTMWKRLKHDRNQERIYEERSLTIETTSSSLFMPSPPPMDSPTKKNIQLSTIT